VQADFMVALSAQKDTEIAAKQIFAQAARLANIVRRWQAMSLGREP
jgi:hypothetical protein